MAEDTCGRGQNTVGGSLPHQGRRPPGSGPAPPGRRTPSCGLGQQTLGDLPLHRHHHALEGQFRQQQVRDHRRRHGVRQVGDQLELRRWRAPAQVLEQEQHLRIELVLVLEDVGVQQADVVALALDGLLGHAGERRVDLDAQHGPGLLHQPHGHAAGAAAHLQDQVVRRQLRRAQDQVDQVEVDQEVLAQLVLRLDAALVEHGAQIGQGLPSRWLHGLLRFLRPWRWDKMPGRLWPRIWPADRFRG